MFFFHTLDALFSGYYTNCCENGTNKQLYELSLQFVVSSQGDEAGDDFKEFFISKLKKSTSSFSTENSLVEALPELTMIETLTER